VLAAVALALEAVREVLAAVALALEAVREELAAVALALEAVREFHFGVNPELTHNRMTIENQLLYSAYFSPSEFRSAAIFLSGRLFLLGPWKTYISIGQKHSQGKGPGTAGILSLKQAIRAISGKKN